MLAGEPFHLRPWEVARLTDYQIQRIYFAPRDDRGQLLLSNPSRKISLDEAYVATWRRQGLSDAAITDLQRIRNAKRAH